MTTIALTPGCPAGVGPELFPLAIKEARTPKETQFIWCASPGLLEKHLGTLNISYERHANTIQLKQTGKSIRCELTDEQDEAIEVKAGLADEIALRCQRKYIDIAISLARRGKIQAIVTGPIRKAALMKKDGTLYDGHTDYLHSHLKSDSGPPLMCFAGAEFLMGLASIHVPLKDVSSAISKQVIEAQISRLSEAAKNYFSLGSAAAKIVVLGLNPHAGEGGLIGSEEREIITPTIQGLIDQGFNCSGPVAADGFFGHLANVPEESMPHAVLAMYHDQGLGPYKLLAKGEAVNITIGLTIVRTSPAHGTADSLAGKYVAKSGSLTKAIEIAARMAH